MQTRQVVRIAVAVVLVIALMGRASNGDKEVIEFKLPKPTIVGTPKDVPAGTTVRKPTGKPRGPWSAPGGTALLSDGKAVSSSDRDPLVGSLDMVTDGDKEAGPGSYVELAPGLQWIQIDLGASQTINGVLMWHSHEDPRVYRDVVVRISEDPEFVTGVTTVFNNDQDNSSGLGAGRDLEFFELAEGELIEVPAKKARYVRAYSRGSTADDQNHYTEVEVWGIPARR